MGFVFDRKLKISYKITLLSIFLFLAFLTPAKAQAGIFGYLSEFWDTITEKTLDAWVYTADWFQQIGNAVAGAIGNVLLFPFKILFDFIWSLKILFDIFYNLLEISFSIITNFFKLIGNLIVEIFNYQPSGENIVNFNPAVISAVKTIPLFTTLLSVLSYVLIALMIFSIIKTLRHF